MVYRRRRNEESYAHTYSPRLGGFSLLKPCQWCCLDSYMPQDSTRYAPCLCIPWEDGSAPANFLQQRLPERAHEPIQANHDILRLTLAFLSV